MSTAELEAVDVTTKPSAPSAEGSTTPGAPAAPGVPAKSQAEEWAELPRMFGSILAAFPPLAELKGTYTDANCMAWGQAMAPIAAARGWTAAQALAWLGPWVALGMATHTLLTPTAVLVARVVREAKAAKAAAAAAAGAEKKDAAPAQA